MWVLSGCGPRAQVSVRRYHFEVSLNRKTTAATHSVCVRLGHQVDHGQTEAGGHEGLDVILHEVDHQCLAQIWRHTAQHLRT